MFRRLFDARGNSWEIIELRLLIVDDNAGFADAARNLLERQGAEVVGIASNGTDAERLARELRPDCVLLDIRLGAESGFDVATRLAAEYAQLVLLISANVESEFVDQIATSPAIGFIVKAGLSVQRITDVLSEARGPTA
jgi:DNA-binding NarL/FixJ family response regulator